MGSRACVAVVRFKRGAGFSPSRLPTRRDDIPDDIPDADDADDGLLLLSSNEGEQACLCVYVCMHVCVYTYIYTHYVLRVYMYIHYNYMCISLSLSIYIYIYICIQSETIYVRKRCDGPPARGR